GRRRGLGGRRRGRRDRVRGLDLQPDHRRGRPHRAHHLPLPARRVRAGFGGRKPSALARLLADLRCRTEAMRRLAVIVVAVAAVAASASAGTPSRRAVPILMYHVVAQPYRGAPNPSLYVARPEFASEVRWLAAHGFS